MQQAEFDFRADDINNSNSTWKEKLDDLQTLRGMTIGHVSLNKDAADVFIEDLAKDMFGILYKANYTAG
jgi:lipase chaperone LimK